MILLQHGLVIPCFDRCQLTIMWTSNINVGLQHKATTSNPSTAIHTCMPAMLGTCNNFIIVLPAQEKDADLVLATNDSAVNDELTPEGQEDDGDWEQVGPRNKSMVTRMVRC